MAVSKEYAARLKALSKAYTSTSEFKQGAVGKSVAAGRSGPVTGGSSTRGFRGNSFQPSRSVEKQVSSTPRKKKSDADNSLAGLIKGQTQVQKDARDSILKTLTSNDSAGAPQNAGQYLMNLLSTGAYVTGEKLKSGSENKDYWSFKNQITPDGSVLKGLGEGLFGQRYDSDGNGTPDRPATPSQTTNKLLPKDASKGAKVGAGLAADIGLDPTTYLTFGIGAGIKGAVKGGAEAARLAAAAEGGASGVAKASAAAKGALRGGASGVANRVADEAAAATVRRGNRVLRKEWAKGARTTAAPVVRTVDEATPVLQRAAAQRAAAAAPAVADDAVRAAEPVAPEPVRVPDVTTPEPAAAAEAVTPEVARIVEDAVPAIKAISDPAERLAKIQELLPTLKGQVTPARADTERLMADTFKAADGAGERVLREDHVATLTALTKERPADALLELKRLSKSDPQVAAIISKKFGDGQSISKLVTAISTRNATGAGATAMTQQYTKLLNAAIGAASKVVRRDGASPESLLGAVTAQGGRITKSPEEFFAKLQAAREDPAEIERLVQANVLLPGKRNGFPTMDALFGAASEGKVPIAEARNMLRALGVDAPTVKGLQTASANAMLHSTGRQTYDDLVAALETPEEVLTKHGVTPEVNAAAAAPDVEEAAAELGRANTDSMVQEFGYDPTDPAMTLDFGSAQGSAIGSGARALGELMARPGSFVESYANTTAREVFSAVVRRADVAATQQKLVGEARRVFMADTVLPALIRVENHARGLGVHPRFFDAEDGLGAALHISTGDIVRNLDSRTVRDLLFPKAFEVKTGVAGGKSMFVNNLGDIMRVAINQDIDAARAWVDTIPKNAWIRSDEGQAAISRLFDELRSTDTLPRLKALSDQQAPLAVAAVKAAARKKGNAVLARLVTASEASDRGAVRDAMLKALNDATESSKPAMEDAGTFLGDSVAQQVNDGIIRGWVGGEAYKAIESDARAVARLAESAEKTAKKQAEAAERRARGKGQKVDPKEQQAERTATVRDDVKTIDEGEENVLAQLAQDAAERTATREDVEPTADILSYFSMVNQIRGLTRMFHGFGKAFEGNFGMGATMKNLDIAEEAAEHAHIGAYADDLKGWIEGKGGGLMRKPKMEGLNIRLQRDLGGNVKLSYEEALTHVKEWWRILADQPDDVALATHLARSGLTQEQQAMATELKQLIDHVFDGSQGGYLNRSGLTGSDLVKAQRQSGFERDNLGGYLFDAGTKPVHQAHLWKEFVAADDPLEVLKRTQRALEHAQELPNLGSQLTSLFSHKGKMIDGSPMSPEQARAMGWKRLNVNNGGLQRFVDPDAYFAPEDIKSMTYLEKLTQESPFISADGARGLVGAYDTVMHFLKASNTIWRVGHHVTVIIGDIAINAMRGVTPANYLRAIKMIRAQGLLKEGDDMLLSNTNRFARAGKVLDEKYSGDVVLVNIHGKIEPIDLTTAARYAQNNGVAMTHNASRDILESMPNRLNPSGWDQFKAGNPYTRLENGVGQFSAVRDNVTRFAQYIHELERGKFTSIEDAMSRAAAPVHEYHPNVNTLSTFERKYARRAFYFYTWMRQAAGLIVKTALDKPGLITIPSKAQYDMAEANGLNPESFGQIYNGDSRMPSYASSSLLGPSFYGGLNPLSTYDPEEGSRKILASSGLAGQYDSAQDAVEAGINGELDGDQLTALISALGLEPKTGPYKRTKTMQKHLEDEGADALAALAGKANMWGISLSTPQIDTLQTLFGGATVKPGDNGFDVAARAGTAISGALSPIISTPLSLMAHHDIGTDPKLWTNTNQLKPGKFLADQSGIPTTILKGLPGGDGNKNGSAYNDLFPDSSAVKYGTPETLEASRQQTQFNAFTGLKLQNYTTEANAAVAKKERNLAGKKSQESTKSSFAEDVAAQKRQRELDAKNAAAVAEEKKQEEIANWPKKVLHDSSLGGKYPTAEAAIAAGGAGQLTDDQMKKLLTAVGESSDYKRRSTLIRHIVKYASEALNAGPPKPKRGQ